MKRQNRKIFLLVVPVHSVSNSELLTNITIHYLPSNTIAHLQPADTGIINSFKQNDDDNLNEIKEIQKLLDQYSNFTFGELMSAKEFILIDDNNNYGEEILDEDIVNMVKSNEMDLIEEELVLQPKISTSKALASLDKDFQLKTSLTFNRGF
ncbi:hypothetical protein RhiirB3_446632 [Rhizophagus irregularis]|nr:hypothetical protein RhiirB3_446632 [Rhizophagus irregularis]